MRKRVSTSKVSASVWTMLLPVMPNSSERAVVIGRCSTPRTGGALRAALRTARLRLRTEQRARRHTCAGPQHARELRVAAESGVEGGLGEIAAFAVGHFLLEAPQLQMVAVRRHR